MTDCPECGKATDESAVNCTSCGAPLGEAGEHAPPRPEGQGPGTLPPMGPARLPEPPPYPPRGMPSGLPRGFWQYPEELPPGPPVYGGFWVRFLAFLIDLFIISAALGWLIWPWDYSSTVGIVMGIVGTITCLGAFFTYFILLTGFRGQTVGKMVLGLRVVTEDLARPDWGTVVSRELSKILSFLTCYIGFIMAGFDSQKRALHDRIGHTRVVRC